MPRANCEGCGKAQPPDWKAGDLCSFCGKAVRHDVRCYWCAKWVPAAKFCRSCGAVVVEERLYGAARMLKDAGTDRFTIPKQLADFDPDQIENFSRIYQRHAVAVARHVDDLRFVERFLRQKAWSALLEEQLVPQLPWPEETLERMSAPAAPAGDDLSALKAIQEHTPFEATRSLARLARLRLRDWTAYKEACAVFHSSDPAVRAEAALALTGWRVLSEFGHPRDIGRPVYEELQKSPFRLEAAVRMASLGREGDELLRDALASPDPETAFAAALVLGDVDRLQAALNGDEQERVAAGRKLIAMGIIKPVVEPIRKSPLEVQRELVDSLVSRKDAAPEAADLLMEIVETTGDAALRERAVRVLCRMLQPSWILRIARAGKGDPHIYQSLLQAPGLDADSAVALGDFLVADGRFTMSQYGLSTLAEKGAMPAAFVPSRFARADEKTKKEMLSFAEKQLGRQEDEGLHVFLMNVAFGPHPAALRAAAWWSLHRWYRNQGEYRGEGPFKLQKEPIVRFFGSVAAFLPKLAAVLRDRDTMKEVGFYEFMAHLLDSSDESGIAAIQAETDGAGDLVRALSEAMKGDYWPNTVEGMIKLLSRIGSHPRWRDEALAALRSAGKKGNYHYDKALRRLELSVHGIPEESDWDRLPLDFVPSRYFGATPEGKLELLKLAEHQLIHKKTTEPDPGIVRMLLEAALRPGPMDLREQAMDVFAERSSQGTRYFPLKRRAVEEAFGDLPRFVSLLPGLVRDAAELVNGRIVDFLYRVFAEPAAEDAALLAAEGEAGQALIRALITLAGAPPVDGNGKHLRWTAIRYLAQAGAHPTWRDEVLQALDRLRTTPDFKHVEECKRAIEQLRPAEPVKPAPPPVVDPHDGEETEPLPPPPPADNPYAEKQKIAERMGKELQAAMMKLMSGPGTVQEKMAEGTRMSQEFQARIKKLYES